MPVGYLMNNKLATFLICSLSLLALPCATATPAGSPVELQVAAIPDKSGQFDLHIRVQNVGQNSLPLFKAGLPWGNSRSMYLTAIQNRAPLAAPTPIDDPVSGEVTLKPGEMLEGDINLLGRFPKLTAELKEHDVDLLWTYQVVTTDGKVLQRLGGWVLLPQSGKR